MAPHKVAGGREFSLSAALTATAYLAFYLLFTGAIQHITTPTIGIRGPHIIYTYTETTLYAGPLIQIIGDGYLINIRLYPVALAAAISTLLGINAGLLWTLYRRGVLRACLLGGTWGGSGGLLASIISFGYACCGWPASLAIFGAGLIASLSPYLTAAAALLLAANAYNLNRRLKIVRGGFHAK
jgi:hypothetical protein